MNGEQHRLALPQGTRIGDFEFHRVLGHGGFGITYLGWNHALDQPVAIKEYLPADLATRERGLSVVPQSSQAAEIFQWGLKRFIDEARILARFQHPNIVRVHHFFEAHSTAYIVMEYVEGETLEAFIDRKGGLTESELKAILHPILDSLEVVHQADFLHRDIKPLNIIIRDDENNSPVLIDFGAARLATGALSGSLAAIISPGYSPIEQYSTRGDQGHWTDIYALGAVCYRALTNEVPAEAPNRVSRDLLTPVSERCGGRASPEFLAAIDHALQVYGSDRPQSVSAWRNELFPPVPPPPPPPPPGRKSRKVLWAVLGMLAFLAVASVVIDYELERRLTDAKQAELLANERNKFVEEIGHEPSPKGVNSEGWTDLHFTSFLDLSTLTLSLLNEGADVNAENNDGWTPLHVAAGAKARETAEVLLKHGAYVNGREKYGWTPLHYAANNKARETAEVLLRHGADVNAKEFESWTPLHYAAREDARETAEVLLKHDADVNAKDDFDATPLHYAAREDARETAEVLLRHDADVNARNNDGETPLYYAVYNNAHEVAELLRRYGGRE